MIYKKPNIKYTDMCIYIDNHIYTDDCDDVKVFEYIFHIITMLSHQASYFKSTADYEDFALQGASRVFMRLKNPKQFQLDENGNPKMERVKSVLNYVKSILYPMKVVFERDNFVQSSIAPDQYQLTNPISFPDQVGESIDRMNLIEFDLYLHDVGRTCRHFLERIPVKQGSSEWLNIYLSCMLTFLNSVTLSNKNKEKLRQLGDVINQKPKILDKLYKEERQDCVILYHLDETYHDYVYVLFNKLRHLVARDLSSTLNTYLPSNINMKNLMMASIDEFGGDIDDED